LITSNLPITQLDFPDTLGTFEAIRRDASRRPFGAAMSLSTAVHMSARFTYVSPPGRLLDDAGRTWGHVIDGGYFENSGAGTALDLYTSLMRAIRRGRGEAHFRNIVPVLVLITNSPSSHEALGTAQRPDQPLDWLADLMSPPLGLMHAREARGRYSLAAMRRGEKGVSGRCVVNFGLKRATPGGHDPILGWYLARESRVEMRSQLQQLDDQVRRVREIVASGRCP
jgi:hypothetical protein